MKKFISLILIALTLALGTIPAYAANTSISSTGTASPQFTGIAILSISLNIASSGCTTSTGSVRPSNSSYTAYLTVSLQKYTSNGWTTLKSWTGSGTGLSGAIVSGSYYVGSGTYRACSTASIYNSSGSLIDAATAYSAEKTF